MFKWKQSLEHENELEKNNSGLDSSRLSFLIGYLYEEDKLKRLLKITGSSHDFTSMSPEVKTKFLYDLTREKHASTPNRWVLFWNK